MPVAIAPNGKPIFACYKCGNRGTSDGTKLVQIDGFKNPNDFHAVRLCEHCRAYLKDHKFPMKEVIPEKVYFDDADCIMA